eukprot:211971-Prorocentrum_minimum.AAC.4
MPGLPLWPSKSLYGIRQLLSVRISVQAFASPDTRENCCGFLRQTPSISLYTPSVSLYTPSTPPLHPLYTPSTPPGLSRASKCRRVVTRRGASWPHRRGTLKNHGREKVKLSGGISGLIKD